MSTMSEAKVSGFMAPSVEQLDELVGWLGSLDGTGGDDVGRMDVLAALERVKSGCAAAQLRVTAAFADSQQQQSDRHLEAARAAADGGDFEAWRAARDAARECTVETDAGTASLGRRSRGRRASRGSGVAAQVGLARRISPPQAARAVNLARTLVADMPYVLELLSVGELSEWRVTIIAGQTATLTPTDRRAVDAELAVQHGEQVGTWGDRELARRVAAIAYRIDAASVVDRLEKAPQERRVTIRPAADGMVWLTALLPLIPGVAVHASLAAAAATAKTSGDERSRSQVMADALIARVLGQPPASHQSADPNASAAEPGRCDVAPVPGPVPVEVGLVMTDRALLSNDPTPAQVPGYGTVPAAWARTLLRTGTSCTGAPGRVKLWLRRLYTAPDDVTLVAMDSTRRVFDGQLRAFVAARDQHCRTPGATPPPHRSTTSTPGPPVGQRPRTTGRAYACAAT